MRLEKIIIYLSQKITDSAVSSGEGKGDQGCIGTFWDGVEIDNLCD